MFAVFTEKIKLQMPTGICLQGLVNNNAYMANKAAVSHIRSITHSKNIQ